jgi:hypothetical protein
MGAWARVGDVFRLHAKRANTPSCLNGVVIGIFSCMPKIGILVNIGAAEGRH